MPSRRPRQRGATLIEIVAASGILGAILMVAVPSLHDVAQSSRLTGAANDFLADLYLARSEAIRRNRRVGLCKSADGTRCTTAGGWEQGWLVFHDDNGNALVEAGEDLIRAQPALAGGLQMRGNQQVARYISFTPLGLTKSTKGAFQAGTLTLCHRSAEPGPARQVVINSVGRPRVQKAQVATCG